LAVGCWLKIIYPSGDSVFGGIFFCGVVLAVGFKL
jgi:hypothetical protein